MEVLFILKTYLKYLLILNSKKFIKNLSNDFKYINSVDFWSI